MSAGPPSLSTELSLDWNVALRRLLEAFMMSDVGSTSKWNKNDPKLSMITHLIGKLFGVDYECENIDNDEGQVCATYPMKLIFLKGERDRIVQQPLALKEPLQRGARFGRVRTRFPMPVILFRGKNICRSSSLTMRLEALVQTTHNTIRDTLTYVDGSNNPISPEQAGIVNLQGSDSAEMNDLLTTLQSETSTSMDKHRLADITLIRTLRVSHIADFMLENCKRVLGVSVCSSEKNDSYRRYADFMLLVLPYPGVEFFRHFNPNQPEAANELVFDWRPWPAVNRPAGSVSFDHESIINWDAVTITKNYLKTLLYSLCDKECTGLLVHCISGWDRTPLFVSLLRLSLWADGEAHASLSAEQILYLTIAYDWMMFRHQLVLRQMHSEDIFAFCFFFLEHITDAEFSVDAMTRRIGSGSFTSSIPAPAPVYRPTTMASYLQDGEIPGETPSPAPANFKNNKPMPSPQSSPGKAAFTSQTPKKSPKPSRAPAPPAEDDKRTFFDQMHIISSYKGKSHLEETMSGMRPLDDVVWKRKAEDSEEDDVYSGSFDSDSSSGAPPSGSFQSLSFGFSPSASSSSISNDKAHHNEANQAQTSTPSTSHAGDASPSAAPHESHSEEHLLKPSSLHHTDHPQVQQPQHHHQPNQPLPALPTSSVLSSSSHMPIAPAAEDPMSHPLDSNSISRTPEQDAQIKFLQARRKERLDAVREAFIRHYKDVMQPYFEGKRKQAGSSIWSWLPSFSISGAPADVVKRA